MENSSTKSLLTKGVSQCDIDCFKAKQFKYRNTTTLPLHTPETGCIWAMQRY